MTDITFSDPHHPCFLLRFPACIDAKSLENAQKPHVIKLSELVRDHGGSKGNLADQGVYIVLDRPSETRLETQTVDEIHEPEHFSEEQKNLIQDAMDQIPVIHHEDPKQKTTSSENKKSSSYTVQDLKELCKKNGLNSSGVKHVLIKRLQEKNCL